MRAFINTVENKDQAVAAMKLHREQDNLIRGTYDEHGKGCAIGCQYNKYYSKPGFEGNTRHALAERVHGIPRQLAYLEDRIFEGLPQDKAMEWPVRFLSAIPVGADLSKVIPQFMVWILSDKEQGVIRFVKPGSDQEKVINAVAALYTRRINGEIIERDEWLEAAGLARGSYRTAWDAYYAARSIANDAWRRFRAGEISAAAVAEVAAAAVAEVAAAAAAAAAAEAVVVAAAAAAAAAVANYRASWSVARENAYVRMADKIIELVQQSPVTE